MSKQTIFIDIDEELFKNKNYDPRVLGWIKYCCFLDQETEGSCFNLDQVRRKLVPHCITYHRFNSAIQLLEDFTLIELGDKYKLLEGAKRSWFVPISEKMLRFLTYSGLDCFESKLLLKLINQDTFYKDKGGFSFSKKKMLELLGYCYNQKNRDRVEQALDKLCSMDLITLGAPYYLAAGMGPFRTVVDIDRELRNQDFEDIADAGTEIAVCVPYNGEIMEVDVPMRDWKKLMQFHQGRNLVQVYAYSFLEDNENIREDLADINVDYCLEIIESVLKEEAA